MILLLYDTYKKIKRYRYNIGQAQARVWDGKLLEKKNSFLVVPRSLPDLQ